MWQLQRATVIGVFSGLGVRAALWARIAQNVKKSPLTVNVINFESFGLKLSVWVPWSPLGPKIC